MKVNVRLFAGLNDLLGQRHVSLELAEGATVAQLRDQLGQEYPAVTPYLTALVCAIDEEYVTSDYALHDGDEVALIPPVSGGGSGADEGWFQVTSEPLDGKRLMEAVRRDESGAVVLFSGVARDHSEGRRVRALEYDAYPSMAEKKLREVADEVRARWPITGIGVLHRTGRLAIGETSLLVAVSAAHRREAFESCLYAVRRSRRATTPWTGSSRSSPSGRKSYGRTATAPGSAAIQSRRLKRWRRGRGRDRTHRSPGVRRVCCEQALGGHA